MKMWPDGSNPNIDPPPVIKMPVRSSRNRRKEVGEVRKARKLSKMGIAMTCSICKSSKHNKRGCPLRSKTTNTFQNSAHSTNESHHNQAPAAPSRKKYSDPPRSEATKQQGLPSSRLISTPKALNSAEVIGDIGYKPSKGLKWKGKKAITQEKLQKQVQTKSKALEIQTRAQTGKSPTKNTS